MPNMPGVVARTSTFALTNVTMPFALEIADNGITKAALMDDRLAKGVNLYDGLITHEKVAQALGYTYSPLNNVIEKWVIN